MKFRMLTRIFRLLHVLQPLDFPGTPTMTEGDSTTLFLMEISIMRDSWRCPSQLHIYSNHLHRRLIVVHRLHLLYPPPSLTNDYT